ncbi:pseudouridine synthase [Tenacibaculum maritimum]|uniref:pseudouridine synthase n=1 Tax=Tenacibaculum maritimum TaxID=107401 RepID=UPI0012E676DD|nr:pseudouridine synthase [Tenacibaculum maritimum]CAA0151473.1 tRNA pseudouridine synthase [Tenacibaculum maritimum]
MKIPIIYQDEHMLCVSKPNNTLVHHAHHSRNVSDEKSLLQLLDEQIGGKYYPIHRLDRKTSGIILLAKKTEYVAKFQKLFTNNEIQKTYYGVIRGHSPKTKIIDTPVKGRDGKVYKEAETHLKTLQTITLNIPVKPYETSRYSLVELKPKTGRLHQLRIHMNKISHPLIGDAKYGDKNHDMMYVNNFGWENMFLHASSLEFVHPFSKEVLFLKSDLPKDWSSLLKEFKWEI